MRVQPLRTRKHLIEVAIPFAPSKACERMLRAGEAQVLGGFNPLVSWMPGWVIHVSSRHGRTWLLAVTVNRDGDRYVVVEIAEVPWADWVGLGNRDSWHPNEGDDPHDSAVRHLLAHRNYLGGGGPPRLPGRPDSME